MDQENVKLIKERIDLAKENIEKLEKQTLAFSNGKEKFLETGEKLQQVIDDLDETIKEVTKLVDSVTNIIVDKTLKRFDDNVDVIKKMLSEINQNNSDNIAQIDKRINDLEIISSKNLKIYGSITILLFIIIIIVSILL